MANVRSEEPDVKGVVGKLTQGAADAGFVYLTDVTEGDHRRRAAAGAAPDRRLRRRRRRGLEAARARAAVPRRPDRGAVRGRAARGGLRTAAVRMRWFAARAGAGARRSSCCRSLAIFLDSPPGELIEALGEPGALDALWLSLRTSVDGAGDHRRGRHAGRVPAGHAPLPRPRAGHHADRAAAGAAARGGGHRPAGRHRPVGDPRRGARGRRHPAHVRDRRRRGRADLRRVAVLPAAGAGLVRGARPQLARRVAHAGRLAGAHVRARRDPDRRARAGRPAGRSRSDARSASSAPR